MAQGILIPATIDTSSLLRQVDVATAEASRREISFNVRPLPLGRISADISEISKSLDAANARVITFGLSATVLAGVVRGLRDVATQAIEVERILTDVNSILQESPKGLQEFSRQLFDISRNTATAFKNVGAVAGEFARQGLPGKETLERTQNTLILSRLSGLNQGAAQTGLTATVNSFSEAGLNTTEIINKLAAVDQAFAVSSKDLIEGLSRSAATAKDAGISFDQLLGIITALQQRTGRGGELIGNSIRSLVARVQRPANQSLLEDVGVPTRDQNGAAFTPIQQLSALAQSYDKLGASQKQQIESQIAGLYQINLLKAGLSDLASQTSIYAQATEVSNQATDEAIRRNQQLNQTTSARLSQLGTTAVETSANIGGVTLKPLVDSGANVIAPILQNINNVITGNSSLGEVGKTISTIILDSIGATLAGPGLITITALLTKLVSKLATDSRAAVGQLLGSAGGNVPNLDAKTASIAQSIQSVGSPNQEVLRQLQQGLISVETAEAAILTEAQKTTAEFVLQQQAALQLGRILAENAAISVNSKTGTIINSGSRTRAGGHIPEDVANIERGMAYAGGYEPGELNTLNMPGVGPVYYNGAEEVKYFPGVNQPAILPPITSKAGQEYLQRFMKRAGFNPYRGKNKYDIGQSEVNDVFGPNQGVNPLGTIFQQLAGGGMRFGGNGIVPNYAVELDNLNFLGNKGYPNPTQDFLAANTIDKVVSQLPAVASLLGRKPNFAFSDLSKYGYHGVHSLNKDTGQTDVQLDRSYANTLAGKPLPDNAPDLDDTLLHELGHDVQFDAQFKGLKGGIPAYSALVYAGILDRVKYGRGIGSAYSRGSYPIEQIPHEIFADVFAQAGLGNLKVPNGSQPEVPLHQLQTYLVGKQTGLIPFGEGFIPNYAITDAVNREQNALYGMGYDPNEVNKSIRYAPPGKGAPNGGVYNTLQERNLRDAMDKHRTPNYAFFPPDPTGIFPTTQTGSSSIPLPTGNNLYPTDPFKSPTAEKLAAAIDQLNSQVPNLVGSLQAAKGASAGNLATPLNLGVRSSAIPLGPTALDPQAQIALGRNTGLQSSGAGIQDLIRALNDNSKIQATGNTQTQNLGEIFKQAQRAGVAQGDIVSTVQRVASEQAQRAGANPEAVAALSRDSGNLATQVIRGLNLNENPAQSQRVFSDELRNLNSNLQRESLTQRYLANLTPDQAQNPRARQRFDRLFDLNAERAAQFANPENELGAIGNRTLVSERVRGFGRSVANGPLGAPGRALQRGGFGLILGAETAGAIARETLPNSAAGDFLGNAAQTIGVGASIAAVNPLAGGAFTVGKLIADFTEAFSNQSDIIRKSNVNAARATEKSQTVVNAIQSFQQANNLTQDAVAKNVAPGVLDRFQKNQNIAFGQLPNDLSGQIAAAKNQDEINALLSARSAEEARKVKDAQTDAQIATGKKIGLANQEDVFKGQDTFENSKSFNERLDATARALISKATPQDLVSTESIQKLLFRQGFEQERQVPIVGSETGETAPQQSKGFNRIVRTIQENTASPELQQRSKEYAEALAKSSQSQNEIYRQQVELTRRINVYSNSLAVAGQLFGSERGAQSNILSSNQAAQAGALRGGFEVALTRARGVGISDDDRNRLTTQFGIQEANRSAAQETTKAITDTSTKFQVGIDNLLGQFKAIDPQAFKAANEALHTGETDESPAIKASVGNQIATQQFFERLINQRGAINSGLGGPDQLKALFDTLKSTQEFFASEQGKAQTRTGANAEGIVSTASQGNVFAQQIADQLATVLNSIRDTRNSSVNAQVNSFLTNRFTNDFNRSQNAAGGFSGFLEGENRGQADLQRLSASRSALDFSRTGESRSQDPFGNREGQVGGAAFANIISSITRLTGDNRIGKGTFDQLAGGNAASIKEVLRQAFNRNFDPQGLNPNGGINVRPDDQRAFDRLSGQRTELENRVAGSTDADSRQKLVAQLQTLDKSIEEIVEKVATSINTDSRHPEQQEIARQIARGQLGADTTARNQIAANFQVPGAADNVAAKYITNSTTLSQQQLDAIRAIRDNVLTKDAQALYSGKVVEAVNGLKNVTSLISQSANINTVQGQINENEGTKRRAAGAASTATQDLNKLFSGVDLSKLVQNAFKGPSGTGAEAGGLTGGLEGKTFTDFTKELSARLIQKPAGPTETGILASFNLGDKAGDQGAVQEALQKRLIANSTLNPTQQEGALKDLGVIADNTAKISALTGTIETLNTTIGALRSEYSKASAAQTTIAKQTLGTNGSVQGGPNIQPTSRVINAGPEDQFGPQLPYTSQSTNRFIDRFSVPPSSQESALSAPQTFIDRFNVPTDQNTAAAVAANAAAAPTVQATNNITVTPQLSVSLAVTAAEGKANDLANSIQQGFADPNFRASLVSLIKGQIQSSNRDNNVQNTEPPTTLVNGAGSNPP